MKVNLLPGFALMATLAIPVAPSILFLSPLAVQAQEMPIEKKIGPRTRNKAQNGTGEMLGRFFYGAPLLLSVQPGGAGMVVYPYNKVNDSTFAFCATYDVVVAIKKGRVT